MTKFSHSQSTSSSFKHKNQTLFINLSIAFSLNFGYYSLWSRQRALSYPCRRNDSSDCFQTRLQNCEKRLLASSCLSFRLSVRSSARKNSAPTVRIFTIFDIWIFFENLSRKFNFHSNLTKITDTLHEYQHTFLITSHSILLRMRNVSDKIVEEIKTQILCSITFLRKSCLYEIMWKKYERARQATDANTVHNRCMLGN
jgi:hypothetical protein